MDICVTVNSKYRRYLYVMLLSLYENNKSESITLHVVQRDFTEEDKDAIREITERFGNEVAYYWVDEHTFDGFPVVKRGLPLEIYFRLLLPEILPVSLERVLLLDVDLIINQSIRELYDTDLGEFVMAAAPNMMTNAEVPVAFRKWYREGRTNWIHYNTGVLLWNLKLLREKYPRNYLFDTAAGMKIERHTFEEEFFNVAFGESLTKTIPAERWNYVVTAIHGYNNPRHEIITGNEEIVRRCAIIHFVGRNPWGRGAKSDVYRIWWSYASRTPFYYGLLEENYWDAEKEVAALQEKVRCLNLLMDGETCKRLLTELEKMQAGPVVVYGAGHLGQALCKVLAVGSIEVDGFADRSREGECCNRPVDYPEKIDQRFPGATHIIISLTENEDSIIKDIKQFTKKKILTIRDLV